MKLFIIGLILSFSFCCQAEQNISAFGKIVSFEVPSSEWKKSDEQSTSSKGMLMFKHSTMKDSNGLSVQPVLSIVYEITPPSVKNIDDYVKYARAKSQYKVETAIQLENGTVVFFYSYSEAGVAHSLTIGHVYSSGFGVQIISDTTVSLLSQLNEEQKAFISSVKIKNG